MGKTGAGRFFLGCIPMVAAVAMLAATPAAGYAQGSAAVSWGENWHGQLGAMYRDQQEESPIGVEGLKNITALATGGSFGLALLSNGQVASWGGNIYGQLGNNGFKANWELGKGHVAVSGLTGVTAVAAANEHALALLSNGTVAAWGNNQFGELGKGRAGFESETDQNQRTPKIVEGLTGVRAIAAGGGSNYALLENGTVMAWGANTQGQLGVEWPQGCQKHKTAGCAAYECKTEIGYQLCSTRPQLVMAADRTPLKEVVAVYAGGESSAYALLKSGQVVSWGNNLKGQLGQPGVETGPHNNFIVPGKVMRSATRPLENVVEVAAGYNHVLARLGNGEVVGWGDSEKGELGETGSLGAEVCQRMHPEMTCVKVAQPVKGLANLPVEALAAGGQYSLALIDHKVYAWGRNQHGELANASTTDSAVPAAVEGIGPVSAISAASRHATALLASGVEPPAPLLTAEAQKGAVGVAWSPANAERQLGRVFERPGVNEAEEEIEESMGSVESASSPAAGEGAPTSETRPRIKGEAREGQLLSVTTGGWIGAAPVAYGYQWQRCRANECVSIPGAIGQTYLAGSEDAKHVLQVLVTAKSAGGASGTAPSVPSEIVKTDEEGRKSKAQSAKLGAMQHSLVLSEVASAPLEAVPYEIKIVIGKKQRTMVLTPLAPGATSAATPPALTSPAPAAKAKAPTPPATLTPAPTLPAPTAPAPTPGAPSPVVQAPKASAPSPPSATATNPKAPGEKAARRAALAS